MLLVLLLGALAEELMFRGYPFQHLEQGIGAIGAITVFSVMFGAVHLANPGASLWGLINTILIGVLLSISYLRTRALWLPWGIHFGWNFALGFLFGLPVSGLRLFNVVVRTTASGPNWITGGSYGLEGSATAVVVILMGVVDSLEATIGAIAQRPTAGDGIPRQLLRHPTLMCIPTPG